jgi:hypothetical protein
MARFSAKDLLKILFGMGLGGGMGGIGGTAGVLLGGGPSNNGADDEYPKEFAPGSHHVYNVVYAPRPDGVQGPYQNMNYMGKADKAIIAEAAEQQSVAEHNEALMKYVRMLPKGATPRQIQAAMDRGREEEKSLPKWWNESNNRREFSVSSSAVKGIRITPEGSVQVQWGTSPKWYTFRNYSNTMLASKAARELLESDSIGRAVYPVVSHPPKKPNPLLGQWNRKNYEAGYAG